MKYWILFYALFILQSGYCFSDTTLIYISSINDSDSIDIPNDSLTIIDSINISSFEIKEEVLSDSVYIKNLDALCFDFKMSYNPIVKSYINLYAKKIKNKTAVMLGLSDYYFPIFEEIFRTYGLPAELKYISIIESALNPRAVSPARAKGLWQFIKSTGMENGLTINKYVDQRFAIIESTNAAAKHLKNLYNTYGDWQLVFAAYNCGPGNVNRAIHRSGGKKDFWEIYRYLPRETRAYVPAFIGAAYVFNYYKDLNITPIPAISFIQRDTIIIKNKLHFNQITKFLDIPLEIIRTLNPQYTRDYVPASEHKSFSLYLPIEHKVKFTELKDTIYSYRSTYFANEILKNKAGYANFSTPSSKRVIHQVRAGESLWLISEKYNVSVKNLKTWNRISGSKIRQGQRLVVYVDKGRKNV